MIRKENPDLMKVWRLDRNQLCTQGAIEQKDTGCGKMGIIDLS